MAAKRKTNVERLQDAGIVSREHPLSEEDEKVLNSLTLDEVKALISVKAKLGPEFINRHARPSMQYGL